MMDFRKGAYSVIDLQRDMPPDLTRSEGQIFSKVFYRVYADCKDRIKALAAALGAVNRYQMGLAVKSAYPPRANGIAGWGLHFSSPDEVDLHGEYFTQRTNIDIQRGVHYPMYWEHDYSQPAIGYVRDWELHPSWGYWFKCVVTLPPSDKQDFMAGVARGAFGFSTGADTTTAQAYNSGEIMYWKIKEISACRLPAEPGLGSLIIDNT